MGLWEKPFSEIQNQEKKHVRREDNFSFGHLLKENLLNSGRVGPMPGIGDSETNRSECSLQIPEK